MSSNKRSPRLTGNRSSEKMSLEEIRLGCIDLAQKGGVSLDEVLLRAKRFEQYVLDLDKGSLQKSKGKSDKLEDLI